MKWGRGASLFESEIVPIEPLPDTDPRPADAEPRRWWLKFWVKRPQEFGGNLQGDCSGYELHRSGSLTVFIDGGKRHVCAPGTWTDCVTETKR